MYHLTGPLLDDSEKPTPAEILQVAALPLVKAEDGARRVVMVTTRGTGRWTLPKGNMMAGLGPHQAAAQEALEEAGLIGHVKKKSIGSYSYWKRLDSFWVLATVMVFPMAVERRVKTFKESGTRLMDEFDFFQAEENVYEPGLKTIIREYGERKMNRSITQKSK